MGKKYKKGHKGSQGVTRVVTLFRYIPERGVTQPPIGSLDPRGCDPQGYPRDSMGFKYVLGSQRVTGV